MAHNHEITKLEDARKQFPGTVSKQRVAGWAKLRSGSTRVEQLEQNLKNFLSRVPWDTDDPAASEEGRVKLREVAAPLKLAWMSTRILPNLSEEARELWFERVAVDWGSLLVRAIRSEHKLEITLPVGSDASVSQATSLVIRSAGNPYVGATAGYHGASQARRTMSSPVGGWRKVLLQIDGIQSLGVRGLTGADRTTIQFPLSYTMSDGGTRPEDVQLDHLYASVDDYISQQIGHEFRVDWNRWDIVDPGALGGQDVPLRGEMSLQTALVRWQSVGTVTTLLLRLRQRGQKRPRSDEGNSTEDRPSVELAAPPTAKRPRQHEATPIPDPPDVSQRDSTPPPAQRNRDRSQTPTVDDRQLSTIGGERTNSLGAKAEHLDGETGADDVPPPRLKPIALPEPPAIYEVDKDTFETMCDYMTQEDADSDDDEVEDDADGGDEEDDEQGQQASRARLSNIRVLQRWSQARHNMISKLIRRGPYTVWTEKAGFHFPGANARCRLMACQLLAVLFIFDRVRETHGVLVLDRPGTGKTWIGWATISFNAMICRQRDEYNRDRLEAETRRGSGNGPHQSSRHCVEPTVDSVCATKPPLQCYCEPDSVLRGLSDGAQEGPVLILCSKANMHDPWILSYEKIFGGTSPKTHPDRPQLIIWHTDTLKSIDRDQRERYTLSAARNRQLKPRLRSEGVVRNTSGTSRIVILTTPQSFQSYFERWHTEAELPLGTLRFSFIIIDEFHEASAESGRTCWGAANLAIRKPPGLENINMPSAQILAMSATPYSSNPFRDLTPAINTIRQSAANAGTDDRAWDARSNIRMHRYSQTRWERCCVNAEKHIKPPPGTKIEKVRKQFLADARRLQKDFMIGREHSAVMFGRPIVLLPPTEHVDILVTMTSEDKKDANQPLQKVEETANNTFQNAMDRYNKMTPAQRKTVAKPDWNRIAVGGSKKDPLVKLASSYPAIVKVQQRYKTKRDQLCAKKNLRACDIDPKTFPSDTRGWNELEEWERASFNQLQVTNVFAHEHGWDLDGDVAASPYQQHVDLFMQSCKAAALRAILTEVLKSRWPEYNRKGTRVVRQEDDDMLLVLSESPIAALITAVILRALVNPKSKHFVGQEVDVVYVGTQRITGPKRSELVDRLNRRSTVGTHYYPDRQPRIMVSTARAMGTGLSFERVRYMAILEPPSSMKSREQMPFRICRAWTQGARKIFWIRNQDSVYETLMQDKRAKFEDLMAQLRGEQGSTPGMNPVTQAATNKS